jgi:predicted KAP-like P-loop ATPase
VRLVPPPLEIEPNQGFTPEKDIFGLKPFGDQLTRLVSALEDPTVLLLDGKWGTGKTTFVKMWCGELTKAGIPNIYFDAFANDYHEDAFLAVAGEIVRRAEELKPKRRKLINSFTKRAVEVAKVLGRASLKVGIRAASAGVLTGDEIEGINFSAETAKTAGEETAKAVDELVKASLKSHNADRLTFEAFRKSLSDLANELSASLQKSDPADTETNTATCPCVFIIDELDRCRPSFSLELLEKIKHFFSVPRFVFVLVSSLDQLEIAVRAAYGNVDSRIYLEKFYHLRLLFPVNAADRAGSTEFGSRSIPKLSVKTGFPS